MQVGTEVLVVVGTAVVVVVLVVGVGVAFVVPSTGFTNCLSLRATLVAVKRWSSELKEIYNDKWIWLSIINLINKVVTNLRMAQKIGWIKLSIINLMNKVETNLWIPKKSLNEKAEEAIKSKTEKINFMYRVVKH